MNQFQFYDVYAVVVILLFYGFFEIYIGTYGQNSQRDRNNWFLELISAFQLFVFIKPIIFPISAYFIIPFFIPINESLFNFSMMIFILITDDFLQYWYHRKAHQWTWLWKLHRPHHTAKEMGVLVSYRNGFLYYIFMPNIWLLGMITHLGFYDEVIISIIIKQIIVASAHSEVKWDRLLYKYKILNPISFLLERIISTPSTHFSHHGKDVSDGISNPNGNFSNLFFFWDVIFGTAKITRKYPHEIGILDDVDDSWKIQLYYPIIKSNNTNSELSK